MKFSAVVSALLIASASAFAPAVPEVCRIAVERQIADENSSKVSHPMVGSSCCRPWRRKFRSLFSQIFSNTVLTIPFLLPL
jgi:hypothetical protein